MAKVFNLKVFCILICTVFIGVNYAETDSNNWIHPDAWGIAESMTDKSKSDIRETDNQLNENKKEQTNYSVTDERIKFTEQMYLKLVRYIFRKSHMRIIPLSNSYLRSINFHISYEQLERLEHTEDIRDIDSIVSDIILQSRANNYTYQLLNWSDEILLYFKEFVEFIKSYQHLVIALLGLIGIIIIIKNTKIKFSIVLLVLLIFFFVWRVKMEYGICTDELQTKNYINFMKQQNFDHCKNIENKDQYAAVKWIQGVFRMDSHSKCVQQIMEKNKLTNKCSIGKIIPKVFVQLLFEPTQVIIDEILMLTMNTVDKFSFPYNYIFAVVILFSFFYLIKDVLRTTIYGLIKIVFQRNRHRRDSRDVLPGTPNQQCIDFTAAVFAKLIREGNQQPIVNVSSQGESIETVPAVNENEIKKVPIKDTTKNSETIKNDTGDGI